MKLFIYRIFIFVGSYIFGLIKLMLIIFLYVPVIVPLQFGTNKPIVSYFEKFIVGTTFEGLVNCLSATIRNFVVVLDKIREKK